MEAMVKTEPLSPLSDDDEIKPVISYASRKLDVVDKWRARLLHTHDDDDANDWAKKLERQIAVQRVILPFLAEDQIRGKAWRRCGLYSRLGAMPRSGLSPHLKRKIKKLQNQDLVKQRLKSEPIKMERNNDLEKCSDNFILPSRNSHFLNRSPFRNLKHLDLSQESGITVLSMNSKHTPSSNRKIAKTKADKSESNHTNSPIKLKIDNCIIPETLTSSETSSQFTLCLNHKKHICPSFLTNLNTSVEISQFPSSLPSYSKEISSITQKSYINQQNDFLSHNAHCSSSIKQDQSLNNSKITNTEDVTLSGLDNLTNSQFDHNSFSKINNTEDNSNKNEISIDQKFSSTQQDIMESHHDQVINNLINNNEVGNSSSNSCLTYISNVSDKSLIENNVDRQHFNSLQVCSLKCLYDTSVLNKTLHTLIPNSCEKMTLKDPNLIKQSYVKAIYTNVATHGSASQSSAMNLQNTNSSIDANSQLISQYSLTFSSTQDSVAVPENFPPDILLSNYCCEYDIAYTKTNLKPNVYDNYYTKKINTTLQHTLEDIIPTEQSLIEFFEASKKSFRKTTVKVSEKVKDILFMLEQDELNQNSK